MSYNFRGRVMILPDQPSKEQVKDYLHWLAHSDFNYHIDDDPEDIIWGELPDGIKKRELGQLCTNSDRMWVYGPTFLWDNYPWEVKL